MRTKGAIFFFILCPLLLKAQVIFKTIIPQQPVVAGESFQVQYTIQNAEKVGNIKTPAFNHFRFVSGPNIYNGSVTTTNGPQSLRNFVYTLEATTAGRFIIPGTVAIANGKQVSSNEVPIDVISKAEAEKLFYRNTDAGNSDYILRPGEDPYEKIKQNLFLKVMVDRTSCFAGEPILATFKLYSRLESKSDIVKNPGFYGFTVYDMVNLADKETTSENVNGRLFDVHTIRKVQLYPLQAGQFMIDAMEVKNNVEFSRSAVNRKTEQEITEGLAGNNDYTGKNDNTEAFETNISTKPVIINVKPLPEKNRPDTFNGAVGNFVITASAANKKMAKNEAGVLEVTISGKGNFTQLSAPVITWPSGIEGFEPVVKDNLDKTKLPLTGKRTFHYSFSSSKPGNYELPAVSFSFFDPVKDTYQRVSTSSLQIAISNEEKKNNLPAENKISITQTNAKASKIAAGIVILLLVIVLTYWITRKNNPAPNAIKEIETRPTIDEIMMPANELLNVSDKEFCNRLYQAVWNYLGTLLGLKGSEMNKAILFSKLEERRVEAEHISALQKILSMCESGMFTTAVLDINKEEMLVETKDVLESIDKNYSEYL